MFQDSIAHVTSGDRYSGQRKLWGRVILRAIYDWVMYRNSPELKQRKLAESAETWLFKPNELFNGFDHVCEMLDIDPEIVRRRARTFTREEVLKAEHVERSGRREGELPSPEERDDEASRLSE